MTTTSTSSSMVSFIAKSTLLFLTSSMSVVPQISFSATSKQTSSSTTPLQVNSATIVAPTDPVMPNGSPPIILLNQQQSIMLGASVGGGFLLCCGGTNILLQFNFSSLLFLVLAASKAKEKGCGNGPAKCRKRDRPYHTWSLEHDVFSQPYFSAWSSSSYHFICIPARKWPNHQR